MDSDIKDIINGGIKALATYIPLTNIALNIYAEIQAKQIKRKVERLENFFVILREQSLSFSNKINEEYISQTDFADIFERTINYVMDERLEEKRKCFQNIFINSVTAKSCSYDKTEKYMRLLDDMGWLEINILNVLHNPQLYNEKAGNVIKDPNEKFVGYTSFGSYRGVELLSKLLNEEENEIKDALYFLESNRLIIEKGNAIQLQTNGHPIHTLDNMLTSKGKDFVSFILKERD